MAAVASQIFGSLLRARERAYASGRLGVARLPAPVISIGNLRVGGSGKTPAVIALGQHLLRTQAVEPQEKIWVAGDDAPSYGFDVLSRGYRRASRELAVALRGDEDVAEVGDEPRLIAQKIHVPVLVHPDRFRAGLEGERRFGTRLHLLDDGFQHRQLARAFDIVLVAPSDLEDRLLPAGRLREPPAALARADAIVWVAEAEPAGTPAASIEARHQAVSGSEPANRGEPLSGDELAFARQRLARFSAAPVFLARKRAVPPLESLSKPLAFCGLARPESFWHTLDSLGFSTAGRHAFRDHHHYSFGDLRRLRAAAREAGADGFITTAKDAMNLPAGRRTAPLQPLQIVEIELQIADLAGLARLALEACGW